MATKRSLGGGRVLGSGRSLAPPATPKQAQHQPSTSLLTPSESSVSLNSQVSSTPASTQDEDIMSKVALGDQTPVGRSSAGNDLVCPICNEAMVTLLQLNRHLDDNHQNLEEVEQVEVKNWFEQQVQKAKKFQPLAVLNQRLKGIDAFEPNGIATATPPRTQSPARQGSPAQAQAHAPAPPPRVVDPEEFVTRNHWQRSSGHDVCTEPQCGRRLGTANGSINCRHCGKLFCEEHTMYQMKLSRAAQHEPVRGVWCRVCETCYKSREGYNDHVGYSKDHTTEFIAIRRKTVDKQYLEVSRLEKRLTRLTQLLANPPPPEPDSSPAGYFRSFTGNRNHLRTLEQSVVTWEEDASVSECPFCHQPFSQYSFRRHHCRLCGRVVCADPDTSCSAEIALNVDGTDSRSSEKVPNQVPVDVRMCKECQYTVFSKADFDRETQHRPADQRSFENLIQFERGIKLLLPKFQRVLQSLQDPDKPPSPAQLADASKIRKRLMDAFTQYDFAARRIRDLPTTSPTQDRLQKAVHSQATTFLHLHMLPLKSLPKIIKHATPNGSLHPNSALATIKSDSANGRRDSNASSSTAATPNPEAITALETEEKELKERLIVLEEQQFLVQEMMAEAKKKRRFDEMAALSGNVDDLSREIDGIQARLKGMDFEGAYLGVPAA